LSHLPYIVVYRVKDGNREAPAFRKIQDRRSGFVVSHLSQSTRRMGHPIIRDLFRVGHPAGLKSEIWGTQSFVDGQMWPPAFISNSLEFEGIESGVVDLFPHAEEQHRILTWRGPPNVGFADNVHPAEQLTRYNVRRVSHRDFSSSKPSDRVIGPGNRRNRGTDE
jgi:hypothetical protein